MDWVTDFVLGIRQIRGEMDISPSRGLSVLLQDTNDADRARLAQFAPLLSRLANLDDVAELAPDASPPLAATALVGDMRLLVPLEGLVDIADEIARIERRLAKQRDELARIEKKLANASFVERAPAEVVEEQRRRGSDLSRSAAKLADQLEALRGAAT